MLKLIIEHIKDRFPEDRFRRTYSDELIRICATFIKSDFADPKFINELTSGSDQKFWSRVSEALIFERIQRKEFETPLKPGIGPDFLLRHENLRIWVEVICPQPIRLGNWCSIQPNIPSSAPHDEILLRWTSAIKEKKEKLLGTGNKNTAGWLKTGIVSESDAYVIAINGCQMRHGPYPALHGISQFPYAVEAAFCIGPRQLKIDKDKCKCIESGYQERLTIINHNGTSVPSCFFLDPCNEMISAIWAVDFNASKIIGNQEPSALIHNPNATNPLPSRFLPSDEEYVATPCGDGEYLLRRVDSN